MSGSEGSTQTFKDIHPDTYIYNKYRPDVVEKLFENLKRINRNRRRKGLPLKRSWVIVDDCGYDDVFKKHKGLKELLMNGRHHGLLFIFTLQYIMTFPSELRSQIDWIFMMREAIPGNRKRLYDSFVPCLSLQEFNKTMDIVTSDYRCLVVHNTATSNKVSRCMFWFKATQGLKFRMGSRQFWMKHLQKYNEHWVSEDDEKKKHQQRNESTQNTLGRSRVRVRLLK